MTMTKFVGEEILKQHLQEGGQRGIQKISERVYFITGYGVSNATLVIGEQSCLLIDALNDTLMAEKALADIAEITNKPIDCLIYTHISHPDHTGGAAVLAKGVTNVLARRSSGVVYGHSHLISGIGQKRGSKQFGFQLSDEEALSMGMGPIGEKGGRCLPLPPTDFIESEKAHFDVDGIEVVLLAAPGETDDMTYVWLPEDKVVCCGDNYYRSWPNLSAIRGGQYRDAAMWIESLNRLLQLDVQCVLPGHTAALKGREQIQTEIGAYRDGLEYVLLETLKGIEQGLTPEELVQRIKLPDDLRQLPQLAELYGTVEWSVRGIYSGYVGWFDGNPTHLGTMPGAERAEKMLAMMGGQDAVLSEIKRAVAQEEMQWAVELCDLLLTAGCLTEEAKQLKAEGLIYLGRMSTSANGRHYYLTCAKKLKGEL